ncbi:MAG: GDP-mannose 4,6-dehydratase [Actinobacteria bacterium]|nr:GDP-mannose 4,6-dehydratase [Actinomycetota bacterium]
MKKALITGITGMAGSHLADYLLTLGDVEVHGALRWRSRPDNIEHLTGKIELHDCDLRDYHNVLQVMDKIKPDFIFHLAAQSFVPTSWVSPAATMKDNIEMQANVFEAVREIGIDPSIQIALSSEEYGLVLPDEVPINEDNPLRPLSPYAVSKIAQDMMGYQYNQSYGLKVVRTRTFNHEGPRRGEVFVTSNFAKQIAEIEAGKKAPVIEVGNLEAKRDWSDVRDVVRGYWLAVNKCIPGEVYVIASGETRTVQQMLDILLGFSTVKVEIRQDPSRMRPSDVEILWGDYTKFHKQTGWEPTIPFEKTLEDLLNYWRHKVSKCL